jgi:diguanylate cyclase (GGDEF)-like protein
MVLVSLVPYTCGMVGIVHSHHLGYMTDTQATVLSALNLTTFLMFYLLVRSGWSQRFRDPVLALPHSLIAVMISMGAYASLGDIRANVVLLVAQIVVLSMFRLQPRQVLWLGITTVAMLGCCIVFVSYRDPVHYKATTGWSHFVLAGSALLSLSLIGKWVSDMRVRIASQARELSDAIGTLQQMATTDMLTGTLNRRMLTELLENEHKQWERSGKAFCVALIDIDHFKQVNDQWGHAVGDVVLRRLVEASRPQMRQVDKLGRWGGEEFLLMLPHVRLDSAAVAADRLRANFEAQRFDEAPGLRVTLSVGVAEVRRGESLEHTIDRADAALYAAKQAGRNRCLVATDADQPVQPPDPDPLAPGRPLGISA